MIGTWSLQMNTGNLRREQAETHPTKATPAVSVTRNLSIINGAASTLLCDFA